MPAVAELDRTHVLLAPGQGNQKPGMGLELAKRSEAAMAVWKFADTALLPHIGVKLTDVAWNGIGEQLKKPEFAQPAIITDALARAAALRETDQLGTPQGHSGLSLGLIAATVNAGASTPEITVLLIGGRVEAFRLAMAKSPKTTMITLNNVDTTVARDLRKSFGLELSLINTDKQIVLGGPVEQIEEMAAALAKEGYGREHVFPLEVDIATHCKYLEPGVEVWREFVYNATIEDPKNGYIIGGSTVMPLTTAGAIKDELVLQLTTTERYRDVIWAFRARGVTTFTELNAFTRLTKMNKEILESFEGQQSARLLVPGADKTIVIGHRLEVPWTERVSREEISRWYREWLADRQGMEVEEVTEDLHFMDGLGLESGDLMALRAKIRERFGRVVPDEEAPRNVCVGQGIDATYRLANS